MSEEDDVEAALRRQVMRRRLVTGVGGLAFGLASLGMGTLMLVLTLQGRLGHRGLIRTGVAGLVLGVLFLSAGWTTLRRGERDTETGRVIPGQLPVPWSSIAAASAALSLGVAAIAAWPLGLYTWIGTLDSGCRSVVGADELTELAGQPIMLDHVSDQSSDLHCTATFVDDDGSPIAVVDMGGDLGGSQFENHLDFMARHGRRALREPIADLGDEAWRIPQGRGTAIALRSGHAGLFIELTGAFGPDAVASLVDRLRGRLAIMAPYSARWIERHGP